MSRLFVPNWRPAGCWSQQTENVVRTRSSAISGQSPVSPVCFECPCYESATQWGQRIIELNLPGRFGRERCGFGTMSSSLGRPAEAIQTRGPTGFYFCFSYKQASFVFLVDVIWYECPRSWLDLESNSSVARVLEKQDLTSHAIYLALCFVFVSTHIKLTQFCAREWISLLCRNVSSFKLSALASVRHPSSCVQSQLQLAAVCKIPSKPKAAGLKSDSCPVCLSSHILLVSLIEHSQIFLDSAYYLVLTFFSGLAETLTQHDFVEKMNFCFMIILLVKIKLCDISSFSLLSHGDQFWGTGISWQ